jgi:hypothetical protein
MFERSVPFWVNAVTTAAVLLCWLGVYAWIRKIKRDQNEKAIK